jgi:hypothetical protein
MEQISRAMTRYLRKLGFQVFGYLDDFCCLGRDRSEAEAAMEAWRRMISDLGFEENRDKTQFPATKMVWLGIEFDSVNMRCSFPLLRIQSVQNRIEATLQSVNKQGSLRLTRKALDRLVGHCSNVARLLVSGRSYLNALYRALHASESIRITLSPSAVDELRRFRDVLMAWNGGTDMMFTKPRIAYEAFTDASMLFGFGTYWNGQFHSTSWSDFGYAPSNIALGELIAVLALLLQWGRHWQGCRIQVKIDSNTTIRGIEKGRVKGDIIGPEATRLVRAILILMCFLDITMEPDYVNTKLNLADGPSRGPLDLLRARVIASLRSEFRYPLQGSPGPLPRPPGPMVPRFRDFFNQCSTHLEAGDISAKLVISILKGDLL